MITVTIGRTFLKAYNEKYKKQYTARQFFDEVYFELFFNHPKYMQWITNSPFVQMKKGQKVDTINESDRKEKLQDLHAKLENGEIDACTAIGFPASEQKGFNSTSGMVTDLTMNPNDEDAYYSWIGGGLGLGVAGGLAILINEPSILLRIFDGWKVYRSYLNANGLEQLRGNQINSWNGQWVGYAYSRYYTDNHDFQGLLTADVFAKSATGYEVNTIKWSKLLFSLSSHYKNLQTIGYIYSLGQTNTTLGFYPINLQSAHSLIEYYEDLFGENEALEDTKSYESLFGLHLKRACEYGAIGLRAFEPEGLRKLFANNKTIKFTTTKVDMIEGEDVFDRQTRIDAAAAKDKQPIITYRTYKTWLLAMITKNKEESLDYSVKVAEALQAYRGRATRTDRINLIKNDLLGSGSKRKFLDALAIVLGDACKEEASNEEIVLYKELRDRIYLMDNEDFGYFVVLLKFDFTYVEYLQSKNN